jgi:hypothetical protein
MPPLKLLTVLFVSALSIASQARSIEARKYEAYIQILPTADIRVTEKIVLAQLPPQFEKKLPIVLNDQMGNKWRVAYSGIHPSVDGRPARYETFVGPRELLLRLDAADMNLVPGEQEHTIAIEYVASNAVRREGNSDSLDKTIGGDFEIDTLDAHILLPNGVPADVVQMDASTDVTPVSSSCACRIERNKQELVIHVTRPLQVGEDLSFGLSFRTGFLQRSFKQRLELLQQNDPVVTAWAKFLGSLAGYYALAFIGLRFLGATRQSTLPAYSTRTLLIASVAMAASSLVVLTTLRVPEVAMPGVFGGILVSMAFGGSPHGPSNPHLWMPFGFVINALFYYILWRVLQAIAQIRSKSKSVIVRGKLGL